MTPVYILVQFPTGVCGNTVTIEVRPFSGTNWVGDLPLAAIPAQKHSVDVYRNADRLGGGGMSCGT